MKPFNCAAQASGHAPRQAGFTLIEMMAGVAISALVLAGAYSLWRTHTVEGMRLEKKIELRNRMTLSSKRIQRSVTLAGLGLQGAANLAKEDAVGSDTLIVYSNLGESQSDLTSDIVHGSSSVIHVADPSLFAGATYVAVSGGGAGEIRKITARAGSALHLDTTFMGDYPCASSHAYPATRERYYTDQLRSQLKRESNGAVQVVADNLKNFQVSFRDKHGASTEITNQVRTVQFSFTGVYPAKEGAMNSIIFSSTAIPRNTL